MQREQLDACRVSERQAVFGGSFQESLDACVRGDPKSVRGWCFLHGGAVVGLVVFKRPPASPDWAGPGDMSIHGLKIDLQWQGLGLGKEAFGLAVDAAGRTWPDAKALVLAVDADNGRALAIYRGFGMSDSGPVVKGHVGPERRMRMSPAR